MCFQAIANEVSNREPDLRLILDKGQKMVDTASPMSDISDLSDKIEGLRSEWKNLQAKVTERQGVLKEARRLADKFYADADMLNAWLQMTEDKLDALGPVSLDEEEANKQLKEAQVSHENTLIFL